MITFGYTKNDIDKLCKNIVILVDTREQKNNHIIDCLNKNNIKYKSKKLDYGDYSFMINKNDFIDRDIYFNSKICIERKNSLEELSTNLSLKRIQFENELLRKGNCKFILLIENANMKDIIDGNYKSKFNKKSFLATLLSYQFRYDVQIVFLNKENVYKYIINTFYYYLRENLK
jgi:ERCC4-type nuclease